MICQWCHHETQTLDICEWCKRPIKDKRKAPTPGADRLRAQELAAVRKNDRILWYAMAGVVFLTLLVVGYTAVYKPQETDELPAYLGAKTWLKNPHKNSELETEGATEGTQAQESPAPEEEEAVDPKEEPKAEEPADTKTPGDKGSGTQPPTTPAPTNPVGQG